MDKDNNVDLNDILLDEKLYKEKHQNFLIYGILYKNFRGYKTIAY